MSNKADQLRVRLPGLLAELDASIDHALSEIRRARRISCHTEGDVGLAWQKGLDDALLLLRPVQQSHERFKAWLREAAEDLGTAAVSADERRALFGEG